MRVLNTDQIKHESLNFSGLDHSRINTMLCDFKSTAAAPETVFLTNLALWATMTINASRVLARQAEMARCHASNGL